MEPRISSRFILAFAPEQWGEVGRFVHLWRTTYEFNRRVGECLNGVSGHFAKALVLHGLANSLTPALAHERVELEQKGHSSNIHSSRLAAVLEEVFCELYSAVECSAQVVRGVYGRLRGVPGSSRDLFKNAKTGKLDRNFPKDLERVLIDGWQWIEPLAGLRDAITHTEPGLCTWTNAETVRYINGSAGSKDRAHVEEDVFGRIQKEEERVNEFLGLVFRHLNSTLKDVEVRLPCGIFQSVAFLRDVKVSELRDFSSGRCLSCRWFDGPERIECAGEEAPSARIPTCPLIQTCGAYRRVKEAAAIEGSR
jgi:hypothetical protein